MAVRKEQVATVGRLIKEAQTLDVNGEELAAYRYYLQCVHYMVQTLSTDILLNQGQGTFPVHQTTQLFTMAKYCLERAESVYSVAHAEGRPLLNPRQLPAPQQPVPITAQPNLQPLTQRPTSPYARTPSPSSYAHTPPAPTGGHARILSAPPTRAQSWPAGQSSVATGNHGRVDQQQPVVNPLHRISYMDHAQLKNKHMMEQYKAYLRQTSTKMLPPSYHDAGLSMLRRLEENVSVARIREQTIARKLRHRELRLQQAESKHRAVSLTSLPLEELCEQVANFEQGKQNWNAFRAKLSASTDSTHISNLIYEVLSTADHPLSRLLGEGQYSVYMLLKPLSSAVEQAGGLPAIEINRDDEKTTGPTHAEKDTSSQPSQSPHIDPAEDDSHLDLLCSEEDEDIFTLSALSRPTSNENSTAKGSGEISPGDDSVDSKLAILRSSLLEEVSDRDSKEVESQDSGTEMPQVKDKPKNGNGIEQLRKRSQRGSMFENDEKLDRYLQEQQMADGSSDSVFFTDGGGVEFSRDDHIASPLSPDEHTPLLGEPAQSSPLPPVDEEEEPDGGAMSRATASGEKVPKITEEPVVFKNLPPLKCSMMLGNEAALAKLMDTADTVVKDAVKLIHSSLENVEKAFASCYPSLDTEDNRELCRTVLEAAFFPAILQNLVIVYRCKNYLEEVAIARNMHRHVNATPKDLSVRKKFWLIDQDHAPYGQAITELRRIPAFQYPSPKLDCLVRMSKTVIQCIDEYYEAQGQPKGSVDTAVGVDDILPILSYVILRSGLPQVATECSLMEDFIHEGYVKGEEGFCLTSFLTALRFVGRMSS